MTEFTASNGKVVSYNEHVPYPINMGSVRLSVEEAEALIEYGAEGGSIEELKAWARPKPPHHSAKAGEGWIVTMHGREYAAVVNNVGRFVLRDTNPIPVTEPMITGGRKVFDPHA